MMIETTPTAAAFRAMRSGEIPRTRLEEATAEHAAGHMSDHQYANERAIAANAEAFAACRSVTPTTADEKAAWDAFWATK